MFYNRRMEDHVPKKWEERTAAFSVGALFLILLIQALKRGVLRGHGNDLTIFMYASDLFFSGRNPYGVEWGLLYPLFAAFAVEPLNFLPPLAAHTVWFCLNATLLVISARLLMVTVAEKRFSWLLFLAALLFFFGQVQSHFRNGQINILLLFCVAAFAWALTKERRSFAALFLAAGISIKLLPAILVLFLAVNREWKVIAQTILWTAVFVFILPFLVAGINIFGYYAVYAQVLTGDIARGAAGGGWEPALRAGLAGLAVLSAVAVHRAINKRGGKPSLLAVFLYLPLLPLAAVNKLQPHYLVLLLPSAMMVAHRIYFEPMPKAVRAGAAVIISLLFASANIANQFELPWLYLAYLLIIYSGSVWWVLSSAKMGITANRR